MSFLVGIQLLSYNFKIAQQPASCIILPPKTIIINIPQQILESFRSKRKKEDEYQVWYFVFTFIFLLTNVIIMLLLVFLNLVFTCFQRKICMRSPIMLYMDDILYKDDILILNFWWVTGTKPTFVHLVLMKTTLPKNFPPTLKLLSWSTKHVDYDQANKLLDDFRITFKQ